MIAEIEWIAMRILTIKKNIFWNDATQISQRCCDIDNTFAKSINIINYGLELDADK